MQSQLSFAHTQVNQHCPLSSPVLTPAFRPGYYVANGYAAPPYVPEMADTRYVVESSAAPPSGPAYYPQSL